MATSREKRQPPERLFLNYGLYHVQNDSLTDVSDAAMTVLTVPVITNPATTNTLTAVDIGFDFSFNGVVYKKVAVTEAGWCALLDPATNPSTIVLTDFVASSSFPSSSINFKTNGFAASHFMLCPWVADQTVIQNTVTSSYRSSPVNTRSSFGYEPVPSGLMVNEVEYGIRAHTDAHSALGRRFVLRWNTRTKANLSDQAFLLKYDVVLYENGRIEFNYAPKRSSEKLYSEELVGKHSENAFVGIIGSSAIATSFRDFSYELGETQTRTQHTWGGAIYNSTYALASGAKFNNELSYIKHWPANNLGARFVFSPPQLLRKELRNKFQIDATHTSYPGTNYGTPNGGESWDSRAELQFSSTKNEFPSGMPRFHGVKQRAALQRQNLSSNEFSLTGTVPSLKASSNFLSNETNSRKIAAFSEVRPDLVDLDDDFFRSGSNAEFYTGVLSADVRNKKHIHMSFPINYSTKFLLTSSAYYYYSPKHKQWLLPPNLVQKSTGSFASPTLTGAPSTVILESFPPFSALGYFQQYGYFSYESAYSQSDLVLALSQDYTTGFGISNEFEANDDFLIEIPITQPFLFEAAVVKFPIAAGRTWLQDYTNQSDVNGGALGGPMATFALFHQEKTSRGSVRSLLLSGTFDSIKDVVAYVSGNIEFENNTPADGVHLINVSTLGVPSNVSTPGFVVNAQSTFTGSVELKMIASQNNGVAVSFYGQSLQAAPTASMSTTTVALNSQGSLLTKSPFGRDKAVHSNGKSVFGKEYAFDFQERVVNPFYEPWAANRIIDGDHVITAFSASASFGYFMHSNIPIYYGIKSPYLLSPGDKLLLVVSKMANTTYLVRQSGSTSNNHDLQLKAGQIDLSMYGSYVQSGAELLYSPTKQQLVTDAIHSVIGNEPVLDQYIGTYSSLYSGSMLDNMVFGTIQSGKQATYSKVGSRRANFMTQNTGSTEGLFFAATSSFDYTLFDRYSFAVQPMWTRAGFERFTKSTSPIERYYDTLIPSFTEMAQRINFKMIYGGGSSPRITLVITHGLADENLYNTPTYARSFPFEPVYSGVSKLQDLNNSFTTTFDGNPTPIAPQTFSTVEITLQCKSEIAGFGSFLQSMQVTDGNLITDYDGFGDFFLNARLSPADVLKVLYGYGNNYDIFVNEKTFKFWQGPDQFDDVVAPIIAGWKYGLRSANAEYTSAYFRPDHFGQFRDMLEQRPLAKFIVSANANTPTITESPVAVKFVDALGNTTRPENTWSSNLSSECTSSLPFFDGTSRNRTDYNINTLNQGLVTIGSNAFGDVTI